MGLHHEFLVIDSGTYSGYPKKTERISEWVELHDDLIGYFSDTLSWVSSYNPSKKETRKGLCRYGPTIITTKNIGKLASILRSWIALFKEGPSTLSLTGSWSWIEGEDPELGQYDKLSFDRSELLSTLEKLLSFCTIVEKSESHKELLHLGV